MTLVKISTVPGKPNELFICGSATFEIKDKLQRELKAVWVPSEKCWTVSIDQRAALLELLSRVHVAAVLDDDIFADVSDQHPAMVRMVQEQTMARSEMTKRHALERSALLATLEPEHKNTGAPAQQDISTDLPRSKPTRRKKGPGMLNEPFTQVSGSDKYGYIVTEVSNNGNSIKAEGFDSDTNEMLSYMSSLYLTWRSRAASGNGAWVEEGQKYDPRTRRGYNFGSAVNYLDPHF